MYHFLKNNYLENGGFFRDVAIFATVNFCFVNLAFAVPPATPYDLGETLAPGCAPGDVNCTVVSPQAHHSYLDDISAISSAIGDLIYFNGTNWVRLPVGTAGQGLSVGVGGVPAWTSAASTIWQQVSNVISPVDASVYRVSVANNSASTLTGFQATNTNDIHNYAGAVFEVKGSGPAYTNNLYFGKYSDMYYVPSWAGNGVMATDQDLVITSAGTADVTNPNPDPQILFQIGGGYTTPVNRMSLNASGLAFTAGSRVNSILNENNFASNSSTALATQSSIKAYVDSHVGTSIQDADTDTSVKVENLPDEDTIRFSTFGTERMYINSSGNVGVGTNSPLVSLFQVGPGAHESGSFSVSGTPGFTNIANFRDQNGESIFRSMGNLADDNFSITFGDQEDINNEPYIGLFSNGNYYNFSRGEIRFLTNNRARYVGFISPLAVASSVVWTLPSADGTNDQVLTTNGSGTLSWTDKAASIWSKVGSEIKPVISSDSLVVGAMGDASSSYIQIDSENGPPPAADCDNDSERGRMILDYSAGNNYIYVCNGAVRGWDLFSLID